MNMKDIKTALGGIAARTLDKCAMTAGPEGRLGRSYRIRVPSGDMTYRSFWVRDAAMMAESGLIGADEVFDWIELICMHGQNGCRQRELRNGLAVPPWSIPDHINFDGGAVFYPGTYDSGDDQGEGLFGFYPPYDNAYYFIDMLYRYWLLKGVEAAAEGLLAPIGGHSPLERAENAFRAGGIDGSTGLCAGVLPHYTVDWGFCDTIVKSGLLLFPSLLRYRAARQLAEMMTACRRADEAGEYGQVAAALGRSVARTFAAGDGWLLSATDVGRQPDVWGTAFAVWTGALAGKALFEAAEALVGAYERGTLSAYGYIRHIPADRDFSARTAWENAGFGPESRRPRLNTYQNGGYWATPAGWCAYAISVLDQALAERLLAELVEHAAAHCDSGAPYEWIDAADATHAGHYYGASAALPYAAAARLAGEEE